MNYGWALHRIYLIHSWIVPCKWLYLKHWVQTVSVSKFHYWIYFGDFLSPLTLSWCCLTTDCSLPHPSRKISWAQACFCIRRGDRKPPRMENKKRLCKFSVLTTESCTMSVTSGQVGQLGEVGAIEDFYLTLSVTLMFVKSYPNC